MEKKKRIALSAGLLAAALLFNPGVLASDDTQEPENSKGHFGFLPPQPPLKLPGSHYFLVKVSSDFNSLGMPSPGRYQTTGVNVYWKTKGVDQERGRPRFSFIGPNLPNCPFSSGAPCSVTLANAEGDPDESAAHDKKLYQLGSSEHLEGLVWVYSDTGATNGNDWFGSPSQNDDFHCYDPALYRTDYSRRTRFFRGFYWGFKDCGNNIENKADIVFDSNGQFVRTTEPDNDVQLSAMFNTQDPELCGDAGSLYCGGYQRPGTAGGKPSGYIYIPSNNLEYMIIEVMGFEARQGNPGAQYTFPIIAMKYTSVSPENYEMEFISTHDSDNSNPPPILKSFYQKGFTSYRNMNPEASNLHLNEPERNDSDGYGRILDFRNIDYLEVDIKSVAHMEIHGAPPMARDNYTGSGRGGVGVSLRKYDWKCSEGPEVVPDGAELNGATEEEYLKANCAYKMRY